MVSVKNLDNLRVVIWQPLLPMTSMETPLVLQVITTLRWVELAQSRRFQAIICTGMILVPLLPVREMEDMEVEHRRQG